MYSLKPEAGKGGCVMHLCRQETWPTSDYSNCNEWCCIGHLLSPVPRVVCKLEFESGEYWGATAI